MKPHIDSSYMKFDDKILDYIFSKGDFPLDIYDYRGHNNYLKYMGRLVSNYSDFVWYYNIYYDKTLNIECTKHEFLKAKKRLYGRLTKENISNNRRSVGQKQKRRKSF